MDENAHNEQSEQTNDNANSGISTASATQFSNSTTDTSNKTPQPRRSSDDILKAVEIDTPQRCIRECLEKAYDVTTVQTFCIDYFYSVHQRIKSSHSFDEIINMIIVHCQQPSEIDRFWMAIEICKPDCYTEYYPRWKKAKEPVSKMESVNTVEYAYRPDNLSEKIEGIESNPLDKNSGELTKWFFKELRQNERSLLLTAVLFEGMSRQKMLQIADQLEKVFS